MHLYPPSWKKAACVYSIKCQLIRQCTVLVFPLSYHNNINRYPYPTLGMCTRPFLGIVMSTYVGLACRAGFHLYHTFDICEK